MLLYYLNVSWCKSICHQEQRQNEHLYSCIRYELKVARTEIFKVRKKFSELNKWCCSIFHAVCDGTKIKTQIPTPICNFCSKLLQWDPRFQSQNCFNFLEFVFVCYFPLSQEILDCSYSNHNSHVYRQFIPSRHVWLRQTMYLVCLI